MKIKILAPLLLAVAAAAVPAEMAWADPPPWAPAHGYRAKHHYVYYPVREIYYEPARDIWFWLEGDNWRFGASLPIDYQPYTRGGVSIELYTDRPYDDHHVVVEHYGRGSRVIERHYRTAPTVIEEHHYYEAVPAKEKKHKRKHGKHQHED